MTKKPFKPGAKNSPYIIKVWDIAMEHITQTDADKLGLSRFPGCVIPYDEGVTIIVSDDEDQAAAMQDYGMSEAFLRIWELAREHEVHEIRIDADGTQYSDLEVFEW